MRVGAASESVETLALWIPSDARKKDSAGRKTLQEGRVCRKKSRREGILGRKEDRKR